MNNNIKWDKVIKRLNIWLMLLTVVMLGFTTLLFETFEMFEIDELEEVHEFCGYTFFLLIAIHLILFRKELIRILTFKTK